ncbi:MAG: hypothetical protein ACREX0_04895 [Noviherbaspirillum sp.]
MLAPGAIAGTGAFSFGVISPPPKAASDNELRDAIEASDAENLAFVVANGIKSIDEPCTDKVYKRRKTLFQEAKNGLIVSLAASDWAECRTENGKSAAIGKLNRLRELFFTDEFSDGASKIPVIRQSTIAKFRGFVENARWEIGDTMFATINLPANNNHYVFDAGRNSEFEDRLVANRDWLHRIFTYATLRKLDGIVLFCDGNPLARPAGSRRDGFAETRRQITKLAAKFPGKILIVHRQGDKASPRAVITWRGNLGELNAGSGWIKLDVNISAKSLFSIAASGAPAVDSRR